MAKHWYVVHTYSGFENKVKRSLEERIKAFEKEEFFDEILVPENAVDAAKGKGTRRKFFPGYILVKMELNDETWHIVKETPKVTGFVGGTTTPPIVPEEEVARLSNQISEGVKSVQQRERFEKGESVRVIQGPFSNFVGTVEEVKPEKGRLRVLVSIFGRATPVELEFSQVEKN
ncbi:MAG: transcription termination/antitermination protein NusG [Deltaproteobacteria bacterium]|nr:MAG: transcription termination/antitermination protein NusG [Deltaproteobacteria bacterium]